MTNGFGTTWEMFRMPGPHIQCFSCVPADTVLSITRRETSPSVPTHLVSAIQEQPKLHLIEIVRS